MYQGSVSRCTTLLAVTLLTVYCDNLWPGYERPLEAAHREQFLPIAEGCLLSEGSLHGHQFVQCILKQLDAFSEPVSIEKSSHTCLHSCLLRALRNNCSVCCECCVRSMC